MDNYVAKFRTRSNKQQLILTKFSVPAALFVVFGLVNVPTIAGATQKLQNQQTELAYRKDTSLISFGRTSLEVFDGSLVHRVTEDVSNRRLRKRIKARFIREIANHLTKYRRLGYDRKVAYLTAEAIYKASLSQKLIAEGHLQKVADIRGVVATVHVDDEGRIHFGEMLNYEPRRPIYCAREGRHSVPRQSGIPCLTKKKKGGGKRLGELPTEVQRIVDDWRQAQKQLLSASKRNRSLRQKASKARRLLRLRDAQLWPELWSQSKKTLLVKFTFKPIYIRPPVDLSTVPLSQPGRSWELPLLAGFTHDTDEEWTYTASTTIEVCWGFGLFWCEDYYYYVEPYFNYSYVFGLRIPMLLKANTSQVKKTGNTYTGKLAVNLEPFNGNADDYEKTGLPKNLIYDGREVLASLCHKKQGCGFGIRGDLPGPKPWFDPLPISAFNVDKINYLEELPGNWPIKSGHINPPDVGEDEMLGEVKIPFDMLFGKADAGVVWAKLFPYLKLNMNGVKKSIELEAGKKKQCSKGHWQKLTYNNPNPQTLKFTIPTSIWTTNQSRYLTFEKHDYTFDLDLQPGVGLHWWVDISYKGLGWKEDGNLPVIYFDWGPSSPNYTLYAHPQTHCGWNLRLIN